MKSITIVAEDRIGLLADISYILGKTRVNIEGVGVNVVGGKAIISLTVRDAKKAKIALGRSGYKVMESNMIVLKLEDKPGELSKITKMLATKGVNISNVHIISRDGKHTILAVIADKARKVKNLLKSYLVSEE